MGSGQTVTVYALQSGTCNLRCALANGEYAECTVKVEATKSLSFDRQVLSVEPAHTKTFVYKVSPADATLEWVYSGAIDGTDYINIVYDPEAREIDGEIGKGTVTIEGIKEGNVNLNAVSSYGNKAQIQVRCEWNYEFKMESAIIMDMNKKTEYHLEYTVNPADAVFEFGEEALKYLETYTENSVTKIKKVETASGHGYFVIVPKSEITGKPLNIKAINPTAATRGQDIGNQTVSVNCHYNMLDIITKIESDGKFSRIEKSQNTNNNVLYMGDGETAKLIFSFAQPKTTATIEKVEFSWDNSGDQLYGENRPSSNMVNAITKDGNGNYIATLQKVCSDRITEVYKITKLYEPYYNNKLIINWDSLGNEYFKWRQYDKSVSNGTDEYFTLVYTPNGDGGQKLSSEARATAAKDTVFIFQEDSEDLPGGVSKCYINCSDGASDNYRNALINSWGGWSKKLKTLYSPMYMDKKLFEENPWLFCPGTIDNGSTYVKWDSDKQLGLNNEYVAKSHKGYHGVHICPHVLTENVTAILENSHDRTIKINAGEVGKLTVTYSHLGENPTFQIPVMLEIRECEKSLITTK